MKRKLKLLGMETTLHTITCVDVLGSKNGWTLLVSFVIGAIADRNPSV
jgi:hypothetical protein